MVAAQDAANGKKYVRMVRRAVGFRGFHQVTFICHMRLVWELADCTLSVEHGRMVAANRSFNIAIIASRYLCI